MDIALIFHSILFGLGIINLVRACSSHLFDLTLFWPVFPYTGGLAASYLWIRPDMWFTTKDHSRDAKSAVSRQADCLVTFIFISLITAVAYYSEDTEPKKYMFIISLCLLIPIGNVASHVFRFGLKKWHKV